MEAAEKSPSARAARLASAAHQALSIALWMPPPFSGSAWLAASPISMTRAAEVDLGRKKPEEPPDTGPHRVASASISARSSAMKRRKLAPRLLRRGKLRSFRQPRPMLAKPSSSTNSQP